MAEPLRVFVAGATGVIGRRLVPRLVAAGHEVSAISRSAEGVEALRAQGVRAEVCDVFDAERLRGIVAAAAPEAVVHQLTALPERIDFRKAETYRLTNWLRTEGTARLLEAAREAGARRLVCQSIAFAYALEGGAIKDEEAPLLRGMPGPLGQAIDAVAEMERAVLSAGTPEGVVLRYGLFYGPGTGYAPGHAMAEEVRRRRLPIVGGGAGISSFVHVDDAADATVAALTRGAPGVYNVVDDDPAPMSRWLPAYAAALGAPRPRRVPAWLARPLAGRAGVHLATRWRGASNAKARSELGWEPRHPSWRDGLAGG